MQPATPATTARLSLWDFAVAVYGRPGVQDACLALQDRLGVDVNMMMFCLWLAACDGIPSDPARFLGPALEISRDWQTTVVAPLRACRQSLKQAAAGGPGAAVDVQAIRALRDQVKKSELEAERLQILALAGLVERVENATPDPHVRRQAAATNLDVYFSAAGVTLDPLGRSHVTRILEAAFGAD
jgi:uncharacterized protein (TIGR02444 family)